MDSNPANNRVLITGANGFIGVRVVKALLERGHADVRCFVRPSSRLGALNQVISQSSSTQRVELIIGDLLSRDDCRRATDGVSIILHLAAGFDKSFAGAFMNSVLSTRNLVEAFLKFGQPKRFVNVSSFAVYSPLNLTRRSVLDEGCSLESSPQARYDAYGFGKLKQEELVKEYGLKDGLPYVILRPGAVFGPGKPALSGRIGINTFGFFIHLGGNNPLPLTYVDNCADAIVLAGITPGVEGEVFNVVDDKPMTSRQFLRAYRKKVKPFFCLHIPYFLTYGLCRLWEKYSEWSKGQLPPVFNRRRCIAEWRGNRYSNRKLHERLGWTPRVQMSQAMTLFLGQFD